ncbi:MAG: CBS domain-containing protein [Rhizobium sp.]|nr:CBS domain-containing protein [Rhizobium sp.]
MHVRAILEEKGRNVLTIKPDATLQDAARVLQENRIGALVVVGLNEQIKGILSERDIVSAVARHGAGALATTVSSAMTANVHRCTEDMTVDGVMSLMSEKRCRHLPVETNGRLAGMVSIGDVVKSRIREIEFEAREIKAYIAG